MDFPHALGLAFRIAIFLTVFATGLATTREDLSYLRHRPALLLRSVLATIVVAPLVAVFLWRVLPIGPTAAIAIVVGALSPGLPTVPRTGRTLGGNVAFATSLLLVTSTLCVITVPLWLGVIGLVSGIDTAVPLPVVARTLALGLVAPLLGGIALRRLAPVLGERLARPLGVTANALLPGLVLVVLIVGVSSIAQLGAAALVAMLLTPAIALVVGHALGGPEPRDRTVLAIANAARFPALAAVVATTSFPEVRALPAVIAYLVISNVVALPYELWRKRVHDAAPESQAATVDAAGSLDQSTAISAHSAPRRSPTA